MTRRDIFLNSDPHIVHDLIPETEIDMDGYLVKYRPETSYYVCLGLKWFAQGISFETDEQAEIQKILDAHSKFKMTYKQARGVYWNFQGTLSTALSALCLGDSKNINEQVQEWMDITISCDNISGVNCVAAHIICELLQKG